MRLRTSDIIFTITIIVSLAGLAIVMVCPYEYQPLGAGIMLVGGGLGSFINHFKP